MEKLTLLGILSYLQKRVVPVSVRNLNYHVIKELISIYAPTVTHLTTDASTVQVSRARYQLHTVAYHVTSG